ncbi:dihydrofolate reductase family protein [Diaminobutyricibacter sp. McL0608]|uniref:dihydrofolate reductase family protein n=1 Tax=Leifsonia sp. McL0608 TaxID=3143537 RepID=UPI0031F2DBD2
MTRIMLGMSVSLDGYVATTDGRVDWVFPNFDDEFTADTMELLTGLDTMLLGRGNYVEQSGAWAHATGPLADIMNNAQKIVFSNTLETADWVNSRLATATPEEEIARLREQGVENVGVAGGARFAQYLSSRGLIDEYRLSVHPIALGAGLPLFTTTVPLRLIGSRTYATGLTTNRYVPASAPDLETVGAARDRVHGAA